MTDAACHAVDCYDCEKVKWISLPSFCHDWYWMFNVLSLCFSGCILLTWHGLFYCRYHPVIGQQHIWGCISSSWGEKIFYLWWKLVEFYKLSNCKIPSAIKRFLLFISSGWLREQTPNQDARCPEPQASSVWTLGPLGNLVQIPASRPHQVINTTSWAAVGH